MRVILDTNVLVAALRSEMGASYAIVAQLPSERFQMALTVPLYLQYQDVLTRPEHMTGASATILMAASHGRAAIAIAQGGLRTSFKALKARSCRA